MGFNDKHDNAGGSDPDFGAIFMSNSETKRECLRSGLFGLPSSYIPFVEKIKAGTTLFLFDYEKKLLHGVFMATCDGGINIIPKAFASTGMQYPAQVKVVPIWECKPLPEKIFRQAIRENYFANNKFTFGLSENQVEKLLHLFNMNKLEPKVPRRHILKAEDMRSERHSVGKVGKSVGPGMLDESVQDDHVLGDENLPVYPGDSSYFNEFSADDILVSKRRRSSKLGRDYKSGDVREYLRSKDESRLAARNNKVGRSVGRGMLDESVPDDHVLGDNNLPVLMHNYPEDSAHYNGFDADDILVNKRRRSSELGVDYTSGDAREYLQSKDERRLAACNNEDYIEKYSYDSKLPLDTVSGYVGDYSEITDYSRFLYENQDYTGTRLRPYTIGEYPPSDKIRVHGDGRSSVSDRLMDEDLRKTDKRMAFSDDGVPSLRNPNVDLPLFYSKPNLEQNSLVENHLRSTSAMIHPFHPNTSCAPQGNESFIPYNSEAPGFSSFGIDTGSESVRPRDESSVLYNSEAPGSNFRQLSPFGINNGSESMRERFSPSTNCRRNLVSREPQLMPTELKDSHKWNNIDDCFSNSVLYGSNRGCTPFNEARKSDQLASESALYEARNTIPSFKSSPAPFPSSDIGNSGRAHSLFHDHNSYFDNNVHPMALQNYLSHEITQPKNSETLNPYVDSLPLDHGYDIGCYSDSQYSNYGHPKRKSSVFSRLSLVQDVNKHGKGNNAQNVEYDFITSVDEVMEMVRQTKRKPKPTQHNNAENLRGKTQSISQRKKNDCFESALEHNKDESLRNKTQMSSPRKTRDCSENALEHNEDESLRNKTQISSLKKKKKGDYFENALDDLNMNSTTVTGGSPKTKAGKAHFVDFKRRSMVRKHNDEIERSSNESKKSENMVLAQQKKRKLIRPNFNQSASFEDKDLGTSRNLQLPLLNGIHNHKDVTESCSTLVNQCGYDVKTEAEAQNVTDPTHSEGKNSSHATEFICSDEGEKSNFQNVVSSASCKEESSHTKENPCMMDNVKSVSLEMERLHAICQEKANVGSLCSLNDRSECVDNKNHQKVLSSVSFKEDSSHAKEGSCLMDNNKKPASLEMESLHAICQEKANVGTLPVLNDVSECSDNKNHQKAVSSASCKEESSHTKEGSCMTGIVKSASLETLHAICPEKESIGTLPSLNDGSEFVDIKNHLKILSSTSCKEESYHTKEGLCTRGSIKSASLESESLNPICQENNADKFICADRGIDADGDMPKDCDFFSVEAKDGSEYLGNSGSEKAPIETCHVEACI